MTLRERWNALSHTTRLVLVELTLIAAVMVIWWYLH